MPTKLAPSHTSDRGYGATNQNPCRVTQNQLRGHPDKGAAVERRRPITPGATATAATIQKSPDATHQSSGQHHRNVRPSAEEQHGQRTRCGDQHRPWMWVCEGPMVTVLQKPTSTSSPSRAKGLGMSTLCNRDILG